MTSPEIIGRLDIASVIVRSFAIVRDRWLSLALLAIALGFAPYLVVGLLDAKDAYANDHDPAAFAIHAAAHLGPALLGHAAIAAVVAVSLVPKNQAGFAGALRPLLAAAPVLVPAWLALECDTFVRLWNDWSQAVQLPSRVGQHLSAVFVLLLMELGLSVVAVGAVGVFTPVAIAEGLGLRGSLARSWRLVRGSRWRLAALHIILLAVVVFVSVIEVIVGAWLSHGIAAPTGSIHALINRAIYTVIIDFWGVLVAVSYLDLRRLHDGALPEQLADVFA